MDIDTLGGIICPTGEHILVLARLVSPVRSTCSMWLAGFAEVEQGRGHLDGFNRDCVSGEY